MSWAVPSFAFLPRFLPVPPHVWRHLGIGGTRMGSQDDSKALHGGFKARFQLFSVHSALQARSTLAGSVPLAGRAPRVPGSAGELQVRTGGAECLGVGRDHSSREELKCCYFNSEKKKKIRKSCSFSHAYFSAFPRV